MPSRHPPISNILDFWLDYFGAPGRQRRELRNELRANLDGSAAERGWETAREGLGSIRALARESAASVRDERRPSWTTGAVLAALLFGFVVLVHAWSMFAFVDGAMATGIPVGHEVTAGVTLLPGSRFTAGNQVNGFGLGFGMVISP
ncbi:hypothetical protein [Luteococcus peritonei]|uniref:DUF1707 domain-containing protein n=1 Tax=Luteococcus peritonei TaxID=88874 RepID=A0ABW4RUH6_9ACTN